MLGKRIYSVKKLAKKMKVNYNNNSIHHEPSQYEYLLMRERARNGDSCPTNKTPTGSFALYIGEQSQRFVVPTSHLSHPLLKILLEKVYNEFEFYESKSGILAVPCSVSTFQEVVSAVECCNQKFDFGDLVEEFIS